MRVVTHLPELFGSGDVGIENEVFLNSRKHFCDMVFDRGIIVTSKPSLGLNCSVGDFMCPFVSILAGNGDKTVDVVADNGDQFFFCKRARFGGQYGFAGKGFFALFLIYFFACARFISCRISVLIKPCLLETVSR